MNAIDEVNQLERKVAQLDTERAKVSAANDAAIQAEQSREYFDADKQAANVAELKARKDTVMLALDKMRERQAVELAKARAVLSALQAKQNATLESRSAAIKADALKAFIAVGGLPQDFEAHYQSVLVARTANKLGEPSKRLSHVAF